MPARAIILTGMLWALAAKASAAADVTWPAFDPPSAPPVEVEEVWHGETIRESYRWLEDTASPESQAWIEGQAQAARALLDQLPLREAFRKRLEEVWDYDKHGLPTLRGGRLFYSRKTGLQNQAVHYWREDAPGAEEKTLLDPNTLSADGTVAIAGFSINPVGDKIAYGISQAGSDWQVWKILDVAAGRTLEDELKWVKFSGASWAADGSGFYYCRYDAPQDEAALKAANVNQRVWFHRIGTPQSEDTLIHEQPDKPQRMFGCFETEDGAHRLLYASEGSAGKNAVFIASRQEDGTFEPFRDLLPHFDADYDFIGNDGGTLYFKTDKDAPRGRLIAIAAADPAPEKWRTVVPEAASVLQSVRYVGGRFIAQLLVDAHDEVHVFDRDGKKIGGVPLPNMASVGGFGGKQSDTEVFYVINGYTLPPEIFRYKVSTGESTSWQKTAVPFAVDSFVTEQIFATSKDGTRVPAFVTRRKDMPLDGANPTILYGYGGFNISLGPGFSPGLATWLEKGGVYVVANLRGGSEYGEEWHRGGQRLNKQNVFDDFIAVAERLIALDYTSPAKLAISGGSNGGLLVAACLQQRPELFAAAAPAVGVHDLLRFQRFTIGWAWQDEYGFPEKDKADFDNLRRLSPYHNVQPGTPYPPTLILTADHDDRVFPAHSYKFAAAMQAVQTPEQRTGTPAVLRIETKAGHGAGTPTAKIIALEADRYAFFAQALGMK